MVPNRVVGTTILLAHLGLTGCFEELTSANGGSLVVVSGNNQLGLINTPLPQEVNVRVVDQDGAGISGQRITFSVQTGGGSVTPLEAVTDFGGFATAMWTLGPIAGENQLRASSSGLPAASVVANADFTLFDIDIRFVTTVNETQRNAFTSATTRWRRVVTGELSDVPVTATAGQCGADSPALDETVDDLVILVSVESIDGPNGSLGTAGPCFVRTSNGLPLVGLMRLDQADLDNLEQTGDLEGVILHEMGHVLGVGTLWDATGLLAEPAEEGGTDPHFTGSAAVAAFNNAGGSLYEGAKVPVEDTGGTGTRDGHWRESVLNTELMTGFLDPQQLNPLSPITTASLEDLGYTVNDDAADAFTVSIPAASATGIPNVRHRLLGDVFLAPLVRIPDR